MTITKEDLDTRYAHWFRNFRQTEQAKAEILRNFSEEPEPYEWTEQDICEQSRKILIKMERSLMHHHPGSATGPGGLHFFWCFVTKWSSFFGVFRLGGLVFSSTGLLFS